MKSRYPSLVDLIPQAKSGEKRQRICIVTPDLLGAVKNGGIGTACGYLAFALAEAGHDVQILFCPIGDAGKDDGWMAGYERRGVKTAALSCCSIEERRGRFFPDSPHLEMSFKVYQWLKDERPFDLILFMDWQGTGFYAMHAKAANLNFADTALAVVIHSPSYWHAIHNGAAPANPLEACVWHIERSAIAMADAVISPSAYMLDWTADRLCPLPERVFMQPNLLEWEGKFQHDSNAPIEEIVFFGRLEFRKGLEQFCAALDILARRNKLPKKATFLGKCAFMGDEHSALYIGRRSARWQGCEVRLETGKGHDEAVAYICEPGRMAVMPSITDNSPYTVYECLLAGTPFLARDVGGIREFLPEGLAEDFLFGDNPAELARKLAARLGKPPMRAQLAIDQEQNARAWREGLPLLAGLAKKSAAGDGDPFISVILTHYNRPQFLRHAVDSLFAQDYGNFEVILADDGSTDKNALKFLDELEPAFRARGWKILRLANGFAPAARNRGVEAARGDWLLFFDDDNIAMPRMLSVCAKAAKGRDAGYLPLMFRVFEGQNIPGENNSREIFLATGNAAAYSVVHNTLSDTTALVNRKTFLDCGGFREDYGIGHEDFELYLRMTLKNEPVAIIPEPLFWYRKSVHKASVQRNTTAAMNRMRSMRPFLELLPPPLAELALMAHGMAGSLHLFDDPDAVAPDQIDITKDPCSATVTVQAANALARRGRSDLAGQLLAALPADEKPAQSALICQRAALAAARGDIAAIKNCAKEFESLGLERGEIAGLYAAILDNLGGRANSLRKDICRELRRLGPVNPLASLLLAGECAGKGDFESAARHFLEALALADREYLKNRPDVAAAVKAGGFICGLQHFLLHGAMDRTLWPEKPRFSRFLGDFPQLLPKLESGCMRAWKFDDRNLAGQMLEILQFGSGEE